MASPHEGVSDIVRDVLNDDKHHDEWDSAETETAHSHTPPQKPHATSQIDHQQQQHNNSITASSSLTKERQDDSDLDISPEDEKRLTQLARSFSALSRKETNYDDIEGQNPFTSNNPRLQPGSDSFSSKAWVRALLSVTARDPEKFKPETAGVMFRNLSAHGYGTATDHQKDFANIWLEGPSYVKKIFGLEKKRKIQILKDFDGVVKSGEMLVVLGKPGSGCSTFLKTVAGETHGFFLSDESSLHYQGVPRKMMHGQFRGEVSYQAEVDVHFPQLTVSETLKFAALARAPEIRPGNVTRDEYAEHMKDVVMAIYGLTHAKDTKVGNDFIRGVSGGERKRVSIAEVALSQAPINCWDNSTRSVVEAILFTRR